MVAVAESVAETTYREALDRLRAAQREYEALQDPRADWQHVQRAARAVVIARADLEHMRAHAPQERESPCRGGVAY